MVWVLLLDEEMDGENCYWWPPVHRDWVGSHNRATILILILVMFRMKFNKIKLKKKKDKIMWRAIF